MRPYLRDLRERITAIIVIEAPSVGLVSLSGRALSGTRVSGDDARDCSVPLSAREYCSENPSGGPCPVEQSGRLPHRTVSGLARRSLVLRPACSQNRPRRPVVSKASMALSPPPLR
jgi:hypothetical protein